MKRYWETLFYLVIGMLLLVRCTPAAGPPPPTAVPTTLPATVAPTASPTAVVMSPEAVVSAFYGWYLDSMGDRSSDDFVNPLVEGLYRDSEFLSPDFIARIDAEVADRGGPGGGDPILLAQDVPESVAVEEASVNGDEATAVLLRYWGGNPEPSPMVVHLRRENGRWLIDDVTPFEVPAAESVVPQPLAHTADMDPVAVTQAFYDWYLAYAGDQDSGPVRNPLVDRAYHDNPLLTPEFAGRVDEIVAGFDGGGYDPFLLAQDVPSTLIADAPAVVGEQVRVTVHRYVRGSRPDAIFVYLVQRDGVWLIDDVTTTELYTLTTETPEGTVQLFYGWYTAAVLRQFEDDSARADYHDSDLLTADYKHYLDELIAEAEAENPEMGLHYDPLLCAQDVPTFVVPDQAFIAGETALVTARTSFQNHLLLLDLRLEGDDGWLINKISCVHSTERTVRAFYAWYLGYIGDRGDGSFRNPLADRAYRWHPLLSPAFVQQVEEMGDEEHGFGHDPFLAAQEVPTNFSVDSGVKGGTAVVRFQFGPEYVHHVLVTTREHQGRQAITAIEPADPLPTSAPADGSDGTAGGSLHNTNTFVSSDFGFSFTFPGDWVIDQMNLGGPGMPADWPVSAGWLVMPSDVAAQLAAQGAPDPNAPAVVAPFNVEVVVGNEAAVSRAYMELAREPVEFGGNNAIKMGSDYKVYVFRHPHRYNTWVVITDWVTEFPGREAQAEVAAPVLQLLLNSLVFEE